MPTRLRRGLRFAHRGTWYLLAGVLVAMAVGAVVASQLLSLAERNPERIADWLSARAGRPVTFEAVETEWTRRGPLLRLDGLRVGERGGVHVGEAEVLVAQYEGLLPGRSFTELRIRGLQLTLQRDDDGRWHVRGLPGQDTGGDPFAVLEGLGELQVVGSRLSIHAPQLGIEATLPRVDLRLRVNGPRVRAAARAWMKEGMSPVNMVVDVDRKLGDGRAHAFANEADLSAWAELARHAGIAAETGTGRAEAWIELASHRVDSVIVDAALENLVLRGTPVAEGRAPPMQRIDALDVLARLQVHGRDWRIDAPKLRIGQGAGSQVLDGLLVAGGERNVLRAQRIDAGPLVAAIALSDRFDAGLRSWLLASAPDAVLHDIDVYGQPDGRLRAQARVEGLRFSTVGDTPGVSGVGGEVSGDANGFSLVLDPDADMRFDWPSGFGPPHDLRLRGTVAGWRDGGRFRIETPALHVQGTGYVADLRGGIAFGGDGGPSRIDLAASLGEAMVPVAKRFWVRHLMPDAAEHWLDAALVAGKLRNGRAIVSGDLGDWPFSTLENAQSKGIFHAEGDLVDAVVKFQPDWPAAERLNGKARFVNDGFVVEGSAQLAGVAVNGLRAELTHYGEAALSVRATTETDAGKMLALLRQSPLHKAHADSLDNLSASGAVAATFALDLPLAGGGAPRIDGNVELRDATLADARWKLSFENVHGTVRYDQDGFAARDLAVVREGRPGRVSLRAGMPHVREGANAFEADLDAVLPVSDLLAQAPELGWLQPHAKGRSRWNIAVAIPQAAAGSSQPAATRVRLRSDLVGTTLDLPQPLRKAEQETLVTTVSTTLPLDDGEVTVAFGNRLALRARGSQGRTGVRVMLGAASVDEAPPESGLVATGRTPYLEAMDWATLATGDGDGLPLRGIDVTADRLQLLGSDFPSTRVVASPDGAATRVVFDGRALAGVLRLPGDKSAAVAGKFERLHWTSSAPGAATATAAPKTAPPDDDGIDPARIPPLQIDVDDMRFGALQLGTVALRTRPTSAGMAIERLQARSPTQKLDASGEWSGGASARTRIGLAIDSSDFGGLIEGFGFGKRIDGGKGELKFEAAWPGSPAAFEIGALEGTLSAVVKDGKLAEVEPGAGRVLGLLSVAELPRRLMLDFRDFFSSGFAFNRIGGTVRFGDGQARSDDIVIDGPAAELRIQGRSNLREQTHDQRIEVLPKTGNLLPAVGAIAGGPVGAAVGAVANAVLRGPLGEMNAKSYRVTGTWQDPKVEVTEHQSANRAKLQPVDPEHLPSP